MQRSIKFLEAVLPAEGLRVVGHKPRGWKSGFKHEFLQSNEGVIAHTQHLEDLDITSYYALATYESPDEGRTAANALWVKSLWLDMDFKQFDAPTDAVAQLTSFAGVVGQPSYVVMSGGGLHVYWVLEEALPVEQWRPLAQAWQATFQHHGVTADAVSADVARVLRLPYTYNRKAEYEQPRLVTIMQDTGARYTPDDLLPHLVEVEIEVDRHEIPRGIVLPAAAFDLPDNGDLENDVFQESHVQGIAKECKQIGQAFVNQAGTPEYVWHAVLQLLRHVVNGRAVAHLFSNKHPTYSERDTDAKLDNLEAKDIGPTTCARFHAINPEGCAGCPHNIVTPLTLGYPTPEPVETPLPPQFKPW